MPNRTLRPCNKPGCPELVTLGYCEKHRLAKRKREDEGRGSSSRRGYGARWRKARLSHLHSNPLCVECGRKGFVVGAAVVDHIAPHRGNQELFWDKDNWQSLCKPCHDRKTWRESRSIYMANVTVVCGPPGSGKSTYVQRLMKRGDLLVDVDKLFQALSGLSTRDKPDILFPYVMEARDAILRKLDTPPADCTAWVIAAAPKAELRSKLAARYKARVILLLVNKEECAKRIREDTNRKGHQTSHVSLAHEWWKEYEPRVGDIIG